MRWCKTARCTDGKGREATAARSAEVGRVLNRVRTPPDPPSFKTSVPTWRPGDTIPLGPGRILRVVDGPGPFTFTVSYSVALRQVGHLEVLEDDPSGGEGTRRPTRNVIPLVLRP